MNHDSGQPNTRYEAHERPPAADPGRVAAHADTELFFMCPNIDEVYTYLRTNDVDKACLNLPEYRLLLKCKF